MASKPSWFDQELTNFRGTRDGNPVLRVVFAPESRDHRGNYRYLDPNGGILQCWVLERYAPELASHGLSREEWNEDRWLYDDVHGEWVDIRGNYPGNEGYIMICPLSVTGKYLALDESVMTAIREKVYKDERFGSLSMSERDEQVKRHNDNKNKQKQYAFDKEQEKDDEYFASNWGNINRRQDAGYSITPR